MSIRSLKGARKVAEGVYASPRVSAQEAEAVKRQLAALGQQHADDVVAKYKIEVMFGTKHTVQGLAYGVLTIWESGQLNGGGENAAYICPGKHKKYNECEGVIPDAAMGLSVVVCPECGVMWKRHDLIGEQFFRLPIQKWADVILHWFIKTGMDADVRLKYTYRHKNLDIRGASEREQDRQMKGDLLNPIRDKEHRTSKLYPLKNIIKDTSAGADLYTRILSFVRS